MLSQYTNLYFPICSLSISILVAFLFFSKKKIKNNETAIYSKLILVGLCESTLYTFICLIAHFWYNEANYGLFQGLNKMIYSVYIVWFAFLLYYVINLYLSNKGRMRISYFSKYILLCTSIIFIILIWILNVDIYFDESTGLSNSFGEASNVLFIGVGLHIFIMAIMAILDLKGSKKKKYIPLYILIVLMIITMIIRQQDPLFSIYSNVLSLTLLVMYFTIENPDLKMLDEYNKNKRLTEINIEDKTNMLFKVSQDVKNPINKIELMSNKISRSNIVEEMHDDAKSINSLSRNVSDIINNVLDISKMDIQNVKVMEATYNVYNLFKQIVIMSKNKLGNKLDFKYSMNSNIPEELYGDLLKIKQVVYSIISNAIEHTQKGFIDLDISSIVKYDVCRLIIRISDSGKGIPLNKINQILEKNYELKEEELSKLKDLDVDLKVTKKIIDILGGSLLIRSEVGKGSDFIIVLDQKISRLETEENSIEKMSRTLSNKKKVLLIEDDYRILELYVKELQRYNAEVTSTMYGKDLIDKINSGLKYDLVLMDDEMEPVNAVEIIKDVDTKNLKVIIMLNKDKESIKEHYLNDYHFVDYLLKNDYKNELKRIIDKFL